MSSLTTLLFANIISVATDYRMLEVNLVFQVPNNALMMSHVYYECEIYAQWLANGWTDTGRDMTFAVEREHHKI